MQRKFTLVVALLVITATVAQPVAAASWSSSNAGPFDPATLDRAGFVSGFNTTDVAQQHGQPSWVVTVESGKLDSLESWANASSKRTVVASYNASNRAVVSAPPGAMGVATLDRLLGSGLAAKSYVSSLSANVYVSNVEPVDSLVNASSLSHPLGTGTIASLRTRFADGEYTTRSIATNEGSPAATVGQAKTLTGTDSVSATGNGTLVGVVDTGCNVGQPTGTLFGNGTAGSDVRLHNLSKDFIEDETVGADGLSAVADPNGHGTHVASTIAANHSNDSYDGYAPDANLLCLRSLNADGSGSTADIAQAIRYAAGQNSKNLTVDVLSMSLGAPTYNEEIAAAVEYAVKQGVIVVVAAGNSRQTVRWTATPSDTPSEGVVTVAAANYSQNVSNVSVGYFSQLGHDPGTTDLSNGVSQGSEITLSAVGMRLTAKVADTNGALRNKTLTGTLMATPTVSGAIAVALDAHPSWKDQPNETADKVAKAATPLPKAAIAETGDGFLNVSNLVSEDYPDQSQDDAMSVPAQGREEFWTWLANSQGGALPLQVAPARSVGA